MAPPSAMPRSSCCPLWRPPDTRARAICRTMGHGARTACHHLQWAGLLPAAELPLLAGQLGWLEGCPAAPRLLVRCLTPPHPLELKCHLRREAVPDHQPLPHGIRPPSLAPTASSPWGSVMTYSSVCLLKEGTPSLPLGWTLRVEGACHHLVHHCILSTDPDAQAIPESLCQMNSLLNI